MNEAETVACKLKLNVLIKLIKLKLMHKYKLICYMVAVLQPSTILAPPFAAPCSKRAAQRGVDNTERTVEQRRTSELSRTDEVTRLSQSCHQRLHHHLGSIACHPPA